jgi:GTP cyclohydrolase I
MTLRPYDLVLDDDDVQAAMALQTRSLSEEQIRRFESYVAEIFSAFGLDLDTPGTRDTPRRFVRALFDVTAFKTECSGGPDCQLSQIIEGPIQFFSLCEHHALPFHGQAYLGYIAHEHIIGISKLTRLVRLFAQRFSVQERLGRQIVDALQTMLQPHGVAVYLQAHHLCTQMRGVREAEPLTRTTFWRGEYERNPALRTEFLEIAQRRE